MRAKKVDSNQARVTEGLRKCGASVLILSMVGKGCPDLLVGLRGKNILVELKDPAKFESQKRLSEDEQRFFDSWKGQVAKCETVQEIMKLFESGSGY